MPSCCGDAAGVVDVADRAAARVAVAAPQLHRHADDLVALRRAAARRRPTSRRHRSWRRSTFIATPHRARDAQPADGSRRRPRRRGRRRRRWWCGRAIMPQRSGGDRAVDAHRREHVRRLHRPAGARRRRRGADLGLVEQEQQRLALDPVDAHVGRAGDLAVGGARSRRRRRPRPRARRRAGRAASASARDLGGPLACRSRRSAAARATMPATLWVPLRRSRSWPPPTDQRG